ncbi:MAG TPA: hypothetical protein VMD04_04720 [Candidatus Margulisiibacteriota bacterium]|nr:hypothetical protein [Candidatus Margulisiibacteriota bacterium]
MLDKKEISNLVIKSLREVNRILGKNEQLKIGKNMDIYGGKSRLDSMGLVNLLVDLEQRLAKEGGIEISIMDAKAFSMKNSPFKNLSTLVDFIHKKGEDL